MNNIYSLLVVGWVILNPVRDFPGTDPIADVERHLYQGHKYADNDKITHVHECTHGVNGILREKHNGPAFYCMSNRAFLFNEIPGTLDDVAKNIPLNMRGKVYDLYLIKAQKWWNKHPSYIFDEFTAYINGSLAREYYGIKGRGESVEQMLECMVYSYHAAKTNDSKIFWRDRARLALAIYYRSGIKSDYFSKMKIYVDEARKGQYDLY
jgi:hypothetical protein